jgi:bZIP transcription factor
MNPDSMVAHHGVPMKRENPEESSSRTTSPTVLLHSNHPDCASSPLAQSQSTLSTSSPLSFDYRHYSHYNHPNSQAKSPMTHSVPTPVRSSSWAAPEARSPMDSVPTMITTENGDPPAFPTFHSTGTAGVKPPVTIIKRKQTGTKKTEKSVTGAGKKDEAITARKQKRLERNRESARLSRRRRKQYLEVLEEKVNLLSLEMDQGRREHAAKAIETVLSKRRYLLDSSPSMDPGTVLALLETSLSRTSNELSILNTFQLQQLKSFALPPHSKFVLWLTLQGDTFFRGGRAASERLSAARIGERVSTSCMHILFYFDVVPCQPN